MISQHTESFLVLVVNSTVLNPSAILITDPRKTYCLGSLTIAATCSNGKHVHLKAKAAGRLCQCLPEV